MDCGPAALQCLLEGHGIRASYARLREACQTDVDGTSIDTLAEVATSMGLTAEQVLVPIESLLRAEADTLPAIVVVRLPGGSNHFVVAWRRHGGRVQVMDPSQGRRWPSLRSFLSTAVRHTVTMKHEAWRRWALSERNLATLRGRLDEVAGERSSARLIAAAADDAHWQALATLEAATRMVEVLVASKSLARGRSAAAAVEALTESVGANGLPGIIPERFWSTLPDTGVSPAGLPTADRVAVPDADSVHVRLSGAVVLRVRKTFASPARAVGKADARPSHTQRRRELTEPSRSVRSELWRHVKEGGWTSAAVVLPALALSAMTVLLQAVLLRGLFDIGALLSPLQRFEALLALIGLLAACALLEPGITATLLRSGRILEARIRTGFLGRLPAMNDQALRSLPVSDLAERARSLLHVRHVPASAAELARTACQLLLTAAGIAWLDPKLTSWVVACATCTVATPLLMRRFLQERELRVRSHNGALGRFFLDALLGIVPTRTHGGEASLSREHESLLTEWVRAGLRLLRLAVGLHGTQLLFGSSFSVLLIGLHGVAESSSGSGLLLAYWALALPGYGTGLGQGLLELIRGRNALARALEPVAGEAPEATQDAGTDDDRRATHTVPPSESAIATPPLPAMRAAGAGGIPGQAESPEAARPAAGASPCASNEPAPRTHAGPSPGVRIDIQGATVLAGGHVLLEELDLHVDPGEHVAVVGPSGAGKTSLLGLLLGWHRAVRGHVEVDGEALTPEALRELRAQTAWIDPSVHLWNTTLVDNVRYGLPDAEATDVASAVEGAGLREVLPSLDAGLLTELEEGGARLSGGEGQRVRVARALMKRAARLVVLDEPFRGLHKGLRRRLLSEVRQRWSNATLLCVTHDLDEAASFERVLVVERGRIAEDGTPRELSAREGSSFRAQAEVERQLRDALSARRGWREMRVRAGRAITVEEPPT